MAETYKIESSMPTGKSSPQFGSEYYVKFYESEGTFPLWFKAAPAEGQTINGTIEGSRFKKEKKEWNGQSSATTPNAPAARPAYKDNSDGMRQGMCFNNAANYVTALATEVVDAETWANTVFQYANALYLKGDLGGDK